MIFPMNNFVVNNSIVQVYLLKMNNQFILNINSLTKALISTLTISIRTNLHEFTTINEHLFKNTQAEFFILFIFLIFQIIFHLLFFFADLLRNNFQFFICFRHLNDFTRLMFFLMKKCNNTR